MNYKLYQHPADKRRAELEFSFGLEPKRSSLFLNYQIKGELSELILPEPGSKVERRDGLWQHSCFEAFFRFADSAKYLELNLSPFSAYNAYLFEAYRSQMQEYNIRPPLLSANREKDSYGFSAKLEAFDISFFSHFSATAILEFKSGELSHWATKHAASKPDFHLSESFIRL